MQIYSNTGILDTIKKKKTNAFVLMVEKKYSANSIPLLFKTCSFSSWRISAEDVWEGGQKSQKQTKFYFIHSCLVTPMIHFAEINESIWWLL